MCCAECTALPHNSTGTRACSGRTRVQSHALTHTRTAAHDVDGAAECARAPAADALCGAEHTDDDGRARANTARCATRSTCASASVVQCSVRDWRPRAAHRRVPSVASAGAMRRAKAVSVSRHLLHPTNQARRLRVCVAGNMLTRRRSQRTT
jgi:hypothetical protein